VGFSRVFSAGCRGVLTHSGFCVVRLAEGISKGCSGLYSGLCISASYCCRFSRVLSAGCRGVLAGSKIV